MELRTLSLFNPSDLISVGVAGLLLLMSMLSWWIILLKSWRLLYFRQQLKHSLRPIDEAHLLTYLQQHQTYATHNPLGQLVTVAECAVKRYRQSRLETSLGLHEWLSGQLQRALNQQQLQTQRGLALLASIGSTAPFVGLLGTVWGVYHALMALHHTTHAHIANVAAPIGEALLMTAFGLAVAIPAVLGYNLLQRANRALIARLNAFADELHDYFISHPHRTDIPPQAVPQN